MNAVPTGTESGRTDPETGIGYSIDKKQYVEETYFDGTMDLDEIIIRNGIKNSINWEMHGYDFVGEASDGELALPMILEKKPDILITDIKMPFMDGLELSEQVKKVLPATKIMILSGYNEFDYAKMAIKIGVTDYLLKPISSEKLLDAVNKVAEEIRKEQSEKEQMNQYAREMQENKESEKFQFFNQVFAGSMPFGECLEQGKQLGIEISAEGYCVILFKIIMIDHPMDYNEDIVSATEDIENLSEQTEKAPVVPERCRRMGIYCTGSCW